MDYNAIFKDVTDAPIVHFYAVEILQDNKNKCFFQSIDYENAHKVFSRLIEEAKKDRFLQAIYFHEVNLGSRNNYIQNMYFCDKATNYSIEKNPMYYWEGMEK